MKRVLSVSCLLLLFLPLLASCRSSKHGPEGTQERFGVNMARQNLWREAMFRFKRAVEMNPGDAQAHNNLAVAYEANGEFDAAAREYREAMRLDKSNQYIQKNYSRLVEFTSRNKKRQKQQSAPAKPAGTEAAAAPVTATAPPATGTAAPPVTVTGEPQKDPPTMQGIGGSGAPPATKPVAVPGVPPSGAPPSTDTAPPPPPPPTDPARSGGFA